MQTTNAFYQLEAECLTGGKIRMNDFRGKKVMIVNVASACGYTPQYRQLEELYRNLKDDLVIIGFPCNDFGNQEPGTEEEIQSFCSAKFDVSFPMATKVKILGENRHPVYDWLLDKSLNGVRDAEVRWNFHKFLVDENGNWLQSFPSSVDPLDDEILSYFEETVS